MHMNQKSRLTYTETREKIQFANKIFSANREKYLQIKGMMGYQPHLRGSASLAGGCRKTI
jgi:hypothetical protein